MASPRVSFVVTCFDLGAFLPEALASIRAQTYTDYEICVVDDGSTDPATRRVLDDLGPDVSVVRSGNRGLSAARNLGVTRTAGEFVCAVDADDVLAPTLLERSIATLDGDPSLAFASHWLEAFGDETWVWTPERCDFPTLLDMNTVNGAALVRRSVVEAVGGWDETFRDGCEDWDFWITLVERGFPGVIIPEILFRYRRRHDSMSRVKFADGGLARLHGRLAAKHDEAFRPYARELLARRDVDIAGNRAAGGAALERLELTALPAQARARDDLAAAGRRRDAWERVRRAREAHQQLVDARVDLERRLSSLRDEASVLQSQSETLQAALNASRDEMFRLQEIRQLADQEIAALRDSWSWRISGPLRVVGSLFPRGGRGRS